MILRSSSFLKRTVCTPLMAFTTVDLPCATWPMVPAPQTVLKAWASHRFAAGELDRQRVNEAGAPMLIVACREMTSGDRGVRSATLSLDKSCKVAAHVGMLHTCWRAAHVSSPLHRLTADCCL